MPELLFLPLLIPVWISLSAAYRRVRLEGHQALLTSCLVECRTTPAEALQTRPFLLTSIPPLPQARCLLTRDLSGHRVPTAAGDRIPVPSSTSPVGFMTLPTVAWGRGQLHLAYSNTLSKLLAGGKGEERKLEVVQGNIFGMPGRSAEEFGVLRPP